MKIVSSAAVLLIIVLQTLTSGAMPQEMINVLVPSPNSPIKTSSGVVGSLQCTKNSDESYAVCASQSNTAIKFNLRPFSFAAKGPNQGSYMNSCDLYEASSQSTSRAVCAMGFSLFNVYLHRVSDMTVNKTVRIGITGNYPHVIIDTPNQAAFVSNCHYSSPAIFKITNIGSSSPIVAAALTSFGSGDNAPSAMLIIDGFLYVHLVLNPGRLARINISAFTWNQTVIFANGESGGYYDNLANDNKFIYDLTSLGILVRCSYKNNIFARFDSLNTGFGTYNNQYYTTLSLAMSPDSSFLLLAASYSGIIVVNTSTFSVDSRVLLPNPASSSYVSAWGRPIILSKNNNTNTYPVCAFTDNNDYLYIFNFKSVPFREAFPTIFPLRSSTINSSSSVSGSLQCTKNSDESYAVCASWSSVAIKYNLQPFSFAAKGPNQGNYMYSCDLYETSSQSTSRAVCAKGAYPASNGVVYFHRVSDMTVNKTITIGGTGNYPHVIIDTPNQVAYISNHIYSPAVYKITNIGSPTPIFAASLSSFGSDDYMPAAMLIIDGFLYIHFYMTPARLARINISTFTWAQTVTFSSGESYGFYDNLANDNKFIYDLTSLGILVRCSYKNNIFARFDSLTTGLSETYSLGVSPDQRTLFVVSNGNSLLQMVDVASFAKFGNVVEVPTAQGRPIVTSSRYVYAFSRDSDYIYAFLFTNPTKTPSVSRTDVITISVSTSMSRSWSISVSGESTATESETIVDCSRIFDEYKCNSSHCQWCHDLGACVRPTDDCSSIQCRYFNTVAAQADANLCPNSACHFCPKTRACLNRTENPVCSCAVASTSSSACGNSEGQCFWCKNDFKYFGRAPNSVKLCIDNETNRSAEGQFCSCQFLPKDICTSSVTCAWCNSTGGCFDASVKSCDKVTCTDFTNVAAAGQCPSPGCQICDGICVNNNTEYAGNRCNVKYFDQTTCEGCHNCTWNEKVLAGVNDANPYCVMSQNAATCPSPLTCSSINLPGFDHENQCLAAGCKYDTQKKECRNFICFNLFLPSFVIQPLGLMIIGFIKDVIMLLLFGVFGDVVLRILKRRLIVPCQFWKNKWDKNRIKVNLERTIYVNDSKARDFTSDKSESFEAYCEKIADKFFELPETNDEEIRKDWKRRIVDAVTFAMFDTGLWFDLDDDCYGKLNDEKEPKKLNGVESLMMNDAQDENNQIREQEIEQKRFTPRESKENSEKQASAVYGDTSNPATIREIQRDELDENQLSVLLQQQHHETKKLLIPEDAITVRPVLQTIVQRVVTENATCVLYYASSRVTSIRAATALNSFPSPLQLSYYLLGIVFLASSSLASVLNYENQAVISRIASYSCASSNSTSSASSDVGVLKSTYLILGFRLMNASTVATVFLVLVKTVRAIWASYVGRFNQLQLPQRLPIMGLFTKRSGQILLGFYFGVVLIFALAGLFYGFKLTASLKVIGITVGILVGDALLLKLIRFLTSRFQEKDLEEQTEEIKVEEEELASRLNLHVNFDQNKNQEPNKNDFDEITVEEVIHVKKQSLTNSAPTSLPQALLVFLFAEEFPTILLTISLQLCYNYMCLVEYKNSFGFTDESMSEISTKEYESRSMTCIWELFQNDVSGYANVLSSFVAFL